jgi:hypothetical protein
VSIFYFGKNTQQCGLTFKFACLGPETITKLVQHFLLKHRTFETALKGETEDQVILSKGSGSTEDPYYQLRMSASEILLWAGWNVSYEAWQSWRDRVLSELFLLLENVPTEYFLAVTSQLASVVPPEKFRDIEKVPELEPLRSFFIRFIPKDLLGKGSAYASFGDSEGKQTVTWWSGAQGPQADETVSLTVRLNFLDSKSSLQDTVTAHANNADKLIEAFHSNFLSLILKQ